MPPPPITVFHVVRFLPVLWSVTLSCAVPRFCSIRSTDPRRRERLAVLRRDCDDDPVEPDQGGRQAHLGQRQRAVLFQRTKELGLDLVEERAAGQRIQLLQRLGLLGRLEAVYRGEKELVRT